LRLDRFLRQLMKALLFLVTTWNQGHRSLEQKVVAVPVLERYDWEIEFPGGGHVPHGEYPRVD
jgi:hypothetical protein